MPDTNLNCNTAELTISAFPATIEHTTNRNDDDDDHRADQLRSAARDVILLEKFVRAIKYLAELGGFWRSSRDKPGTSGLRTVDTQAVSAFW